MQPEYEYTRDIAPGAIGARARLVQEWLSLAGHHVAIDGRFGPATAAALATFQRTHDLPPTSIADRITFERLVAPMTAALRPVTLPPGATLGAAMVHVAEQHLAQHPREIGGENRGPWVRLYMSGHEGIEWRWCAGFASFIAGQAARAIGRRLPFDPAVSCDLLAAHAARAGLLRRSVNGRPPGTIRPGSLFLVRRNPGDWMHTGIVLSAGPEIFHTIEGNTNDLGAADGYEVCARVRGYARKDFILIG